MVKKKTDTTNKSKTRTTKRSAQKPKCNKPCAKTCKKKTCIKQPEPSVLESNEPTKQPKKTLFGKLLSILGITR